jgi:hypothetical protein
MSLACPGCGIFTPKVFAPSLPVYDSYDTLDALQSRMTLITASDLLSVQYLRRLPHRSVRT